MRPPSDVPPIDPTDWTDVLAPLSGALYENVVQAWAQTRDRRATALWRAVGRFAIDARNRGIPVSDVLRALNAVIDPRVGGDVALDWDHLREHAGKVVIANYYRDPGTSDDEVQLLQPSPPTSSAPPAPLTERGGEPRRIGDTTGSDG